jgi:NAD(P)-dependent dehydrogenase (short-subunit alcohol dehydrogenase family)
VTEAEAMIDFQFDGEVAIVTGAGGGIGSAVSRGLIDSGARVVLVDVDADRLNELAADLPADRVLALVADVRDPAQVESLVSSATERFGSVEMLFNNAGAGYHTLPEDLTLDAWNAVLRLNLTGYFLMAQTVGRQMIAKKIPGRIVNTSSINGASAMGRGNFVYSISKAGVLHFTKELALEWGHHGIRVNAILPSQVEAPAMRQWMNEVSLDGETLGHKFLNGVPLKRLVTAQDMVGPVCFLLSSASAMVTGLGLPVDGGNLICNVASTVR